MINKLSISLAVLLAIAIGIIVYLLNNNDSSKLRDELEKSKGRVEIYEREKQALTKQIDSVSKVSVMWEARFDSMPKNQTVVIVRTNEKAKAVANLSAIKGVNVLSGNLSSSSTHR